MRRIWAATVAHKEGAADQFEWFITHVTPPDPPTPYPIGLRVRFTTVLVTRLVHYGRDLIRAELDAAFFYWYGLSNDEIGFVLDSFGTGSKQEIAAHGRFVSRDRIDFAGRSLSTAIQAASRTRRRLNLLQRDSAFVLAQKVQRD